MKLRPNRLGSVKRDAVSEFVDDQGFRDLMALIEPEYTVIVAHHHCSIGENVCREKGAVKGKFKVK